MQDELRRIFLVTEIRTKYQLHHLLLFYFMEMNRLPRGLWPVMLTPFKENNEIDFDGLDALIDFYVQTGADGLFSTCLSSEMFQLTNEERLKVIGAVVKRVGDKIPVVASGTFTPHVMESVAFIRRAYDTGVRTVVVLTNQIADVQEDEDTFRKRMEVLMKDTGDIPLGVYECPDPYKRLISPALMRWLGETGRFFYHKDTSCDIEEIRAKLGVISGTNLSLYNANTTTALTSLGSGAAGISPIGANLYPELYAFLIQSFHKLGESEQLAHLNAQLDMMDAIVDQGYPFSAKFFLKARRLPIGTTCRIPFHVMKRENYLKLEALQVVFRQTADAYGINVNLT